ncbi:hypothetical protein DMH04_31435 [Kibdelosporangium aridum]|uniref:Uncharacterized protein n=1 Tax=Kibdelosporangium aridum TaxID=2030 RepID=A0A428Z2F3_KIBAR|nr:hypothetical protein DMH04_31435 [Kibdelosporangium aridum]
MNLQHSADRRVYVEQVADPRDAPGCAACAGRGSGRQQTHTWAGVTDLGPDQATPAQIAESSRGH